MNNAFSKEIPNSAPREEFLIVIDYLLNYAYDEQHAAQASKILKYAKEKYNRDIRRDRIPQILQHLELLSSSKQFKLPFVFRVKKLNSTKKYYISQRMFTNDEILNILVSIRKNKDINQYLTDSLCKKILDISVNKQLQDDINKKLSKRLFGGVDKTIADSTSDVNTKFLEAMDNTLRLVFKLKDPKRIEASVSRDYLTQNKIDLSAQEIFGLAYGTTVSKKAASAIIYLDDSKIAIITKMDNLEIIRTNEIWSDVSKIKYDLKGNEQYSDISSWLNDHYRGKDGKLNEFVLEVSMENAPYFEKFKKEFKNYWHEDMNYQQTTRKVHFKRVDKNTHTVINDTREIKAAQITLTSNFPSFFHWYLTLGNIHKVEIVSPKKWNVFFSKILVMKYLSRLNNCSNDFNYKLVKEEKVKPIENENKKAEA